MFEHLLIGCIPHSTHFFWPSSYPSLPWFLQDSDIQKKIDHEIRMRDGACKLLAACSQKDQALEAAKSLQTCSTRIMAYMSELQRMKEAQVMQKVTRRSSDVGPMDDRLPCKGKVAISGKLKCVGISDCVLLKSLHSWTQVNRRHFLYHAEIMKMKI